MEINQNPGKARNNNEYNKKIMPGQGKQGTTMQKTTNKTWDSNNGKKIL